MMQNFVRLSEELFLMYTYVQTTVDDANVTKIKSHGQNPRNQK